MSFIFIFIKRIFDPLCEDDTENRFRKRERERNDKRVDFLNVGDGGKGGRGF